MTIQTARCRILTWVLLLPLGFVGCAPAEDTTMTLEPLPGAVEYTAALRQQLDAAWRALGPDYAPRTEHLREDGSPVYTNRLILEDSPYLRQHAHNPVDWYPWGEEAFERARRENKPIFLSIGYSTCHWCHVMERESFESEAIARQMNELFVCIKVDREQRPDVDEIYMTAVQLQTGRGGWPMSSFLTPDGEPFYGGTYFTPKQFTELMTGVANAWQIQRDELVGRARQVTRAVHEAVQARGEAQAVRGEAVDRAIADLLKRHDREFGGFGSAPKFPNEPQLLLLLDRALRQGDAEAREAVVRTLDAMAQGGLYDQVGGGFHRYATDRQWMVPHFEKMLYNQAHLGRAYLLTGQLTGDPLHERVVRQTLDYVLREMTSPEGVFYSATDADSEGHEGRFFVWTPPQIRQVLKKEDAALAIALFGLTETGNFEGRTILHLPVRLDDLAAQKGLSVDPFLKRVDRIRDELWRARAEREPPLLDSKILTAWNGMMIAAFADAAAVFGDERYARAAARAADRLWQVHRRPDGDLWRVGLEGRLNTVGVLDDYAQFAQGLIAVYDQSGEAKWLDRAIQIADRMIERFWDEDGGAFFISAADVDPLLLTRAKSPYDGAIPSGNSVAVRVLAQLVQRTAETRFDRRYDAAVAALSHAVGRAPSGLSYLLLATVEREYGTVGPRKYAARGKVRIHAEAPWQEGEPLRVTVRIAEGWHINAHQPRQSELIPTVLRAAERSGWTLDAVRYPPARRVALAFQDEPLDVYDGTVEITAMIRRPETGETLPRLELALQACDDQACLRPETVRLEVPGTSSDQ